MGWGATHRVCVSRVTISGPPAGSAVPDDLAPVRGRHLAGSGGPRAPPGAGAAGECHSRASIACLNVKRNQRCSPKSNSFPVLLEELCRAVNFHTSFCPLNVGLSAESVKYSKFLTWHSLIFCQSKQSQRIDESVKGIMVTSPQSGGVSVEEFHGGLQEVTHFPLRPFVLPFLRSHLPLLQRELQSLARRASMVGIFSIFVPVLLALFSFLQLVILKFLVQF